MYSTISNNVLHLYCEHATFSRSNPSFMYLPFLVDVVECLQRKCIWYADACRPLSPLLKGVYVESVKRLLVFWAFSVVIVDIKRVSRGVTRRRLHAPTPWDSQPANLRSSVARMSQATLAAHPSEFLCPRGISHTSWWCTLLHLLHLQRFHGSCPEWYGGCNSG